jgi:hypothetical protein
MSQTSPEPWAYLAARCCRRMSTRPRMCLHGHAHAAQLTQPDQATSIFWRSDSEDMTKTGRDELRVRDLLTAQPQPDVH